MSACGAVGALIVGGRVVGQLRCDLDEGHDNPLLRPASFVDIIAGRVQNGGTVMVAPGVPHSMTMTWAPEAEPDLDALDPDESFDTVVDFGPVNDGRAPMYGGRDDDGI